MGDLVLRDFPGPSPWLRLVFLIRLAVCGFAVPLRGVGHETINPRSLLSGYSLRRDSVSEEVVAQLTAIDARALPPPSGYRT